MVRLASLGPIVAVETSVVVAAMVALVDAYRTDVVVVVVVIVVTDDIVSPNVVAVVMVVHHHHHHDPSTAVPHWSVCDPNIAFGWVK